VNRIGHLILAQQEKKKVEAMIYPLRVVLVQNHSISSMAPGRDINSSRTQPVLAGKVIKQKSARKRVFGQMPKSVSIIHFLIEMQQKIQDHSFV
jgi:hypothetical protein